MSIQDDLNVIAKNEGGISNDPSDPGGLTVGGISKAANPDLFAGGHMPTHSEIQQRYILKYVIGPGFDKVQDSKLQMQLVDFGVNSGPATAIKAIQTALGLVADGILGPVTLVAINSANPATLGNSLVVERVKMIARIVSNNPSQLKFLVGWINRATEFAL